MAVELPAGVSKDTVRAVFEALTQGVVIDGSGGAAQQVEVTNFPETQPVSGPVTEAELTAVVGLLSAGAYSDDTGAADGSVIGLLKGIYVQNVQIIALLTSIDTKTPEPA